jgi:hypothetical protein
MKPVLEYSEVVCGRCGAGALPVALPWVLRMRRGRFLCSKCLLEGWRWADFGFIGATLMAGLIGLGLAGHKGMSGWRLLVLFSMWSGSIFGALFLCVWKSVLRRQIREQGCVWKLAALADQGRWEEVWAEGHAFLFEGGVLESVAVGGWVAVADVWMGGKQNLAEAEELSRIALTPRRPGASSRLNDGPAKAVRACVLLAHGKTEEAEQMLKEAGRLSGPAEKAAAWMWAEICRRKGDAQGEARWPEEARRLDPAGAYAMRWGEAQRKCDS